MHGLVDHKIYLQPLGFLRGSLAFEAVKSGQARWLAGGPLAFNMVKIIYRQASARQAEEYIPLSNLDNHISDMALIQQEEITALLEKISAERSIMTSLSLSYREKRRPLIQGIVNVTPDSFSDGGCFAEGGQAIEHARSLIAAGADIIDIGGESTRPGAVKLSVKEELERVIPVIKALSDIAVPISVDTRNGEVMRQALKAGATIINDVSALTHDPHALEIVANAECPVIFMHAQNDPDSMQVDPRYNDVVLDVYDYLESRINICQAAGIDRQRIILDPGIGFGKTAAHNIELIANFSLFHGLGLPLLLGVSRKSFIGYITGEKVASQRLAGSLSSGQIGYEQGVQILRVHDVKESVQARDIWVGLSG